MVFYILYRNSWLLRVRAITELVRFPEMILKTNEQYYQIKNNIIIQLNDTFLFWKLGDKIPTISHISIQQLYKITFFISWRLPILPHVGTSYLILENTVYTNSSFL